MERVTGIGGIFFKARDLKTMAAWYRDNLGIEVENNMFEFVCQAKEAAERTARTVWSLFPADTNYFGVGSAPFMINYRVANLDRMLNQLLSQGVKIEGSEDSEYGRFAWVTDPEGNRVELWEPK